MADAKEKPTKKAEAPKKDAAAGEEAGGYESGAVEKKSKKQPWTLDRCLRAARRFDSVSAWQKGAPSSYKAASARNWLDKCVAYMKPGTDRKSNNDKRPTKSFPKSA